jgi:hypothetical protein
MLKIALPNGFCHFAQNHRKKLKLKNRQIVKYCLKSFVRTKNELPSRLFIA